VATLVFELIEELSAPKPAAVAKAAVLKTTRELLAGSLISAFLAESNNSDPAGVLTLNACAAIYAGGRFGEITELYVRPPFRSQSVGAQLIQAAVEFGKVQGWTRLEVCAPPVPPWERSVSFYQKNGFLLLGPRLKLLLD
jgi:GNAT superfamily N-acetyltransferase